MPRGDGTGPMGMGPRSGRGAGFCAGYNVPGYANPVPGRGGWGAGRGLGYGRGLGLGLGLGFRGGRGRVAWWGGVPCAAPMAAAPTAQQEREVLRGQVEALEGTLENLRQRLAELGRSAGESGKA